MNTVATHDGTFHADEVIAYAILNKIQPRVLTRTRDQKVIDSSYIVIDVGGVFNPNKRRFDHHQEDCNEVFAKMGFIPLSSAGMIWKYYGKKFIKIYTKRMAYSPNASDIVQIYQSFYNRFIKEIDAIDNGYVQCKDTTKRAYQIFTNLTGTISRFNHRDARDYDKQMKHFIQAADYALKTIEIHLMELISKQADKNKDYNTVKNAIADNKNQVQDGIIASYLKQS